MAETLSLISLISFLAAGAFGILTVILWFVFRIPTVQGELSGRIVRKSIERMRKSNEEAAKPIWEPGTTMGEHQQSPAHMRQAEKSRSGGEKAKTDLLSQGPPGVDHGGKTELLTGERGTEAAAKGPLSRRAPMVKIVLIEDILFIHTREVIE